MSKLKRDQPDDLATAELIGANARRALVEGAAYPGEWRPIPTLGEYSALTPNEVKVAQVHDGLRVGLSHLVGMGLVETGGKTRHDSAAMYRVTVKGRLFVKRTQLDVQIALEDYE